MITAHILYDFRLNGEYMRRDEDLVLADFQPFLFNNCVVRGLAEVDKLCLMHNWCIT